jgi:TolB-like protein
MTEVVGFAQTTRVAILDFDNISGIAKYDGLGKAMSSMLISDIEANVSPKRLQLVERAQIQKVLKEQNFQASGSVNKSTAVQAGQILGVSYLLVGDIYILNDQLIINARLTNTETGDIVFAKNQEGKTVDWLNLKTNIAKELAISLSQPFTIPTIPDMETPIATLTTYGNAIDAKDFGDLNKAEILVGTVLDFSPNFKYTEDLTKEINELKIRMKQVEQDVNVLKKSGGRIINATSFMELKNNLMNPLTSYNEQYELLLILLNNYPNEMEKESHYGPFIYYPHPTNETEFNLLAELRELRVLHDKCNKPQQLIEYFLLRLDHLLHLEQANQIRNTNTTMEIRFNKLNEIINEFQYIFSTAPLKNNYIIKSYFYLKLLVSIASQNYTALISQIFEKDANSALEEYEQLQEVFWTRLHRINYFPLALKLFKDNFNMALGNPKFWEADDHITQEARFDSIYNYRHLSEIHSLMYHYKTRHYVTNKPLIEFNFLSEQFLQKLHEIWNDEEKKLNDEDLEIEIDNKEPNENENTDN